MYVAFKPAKIQVYIKLNIQCEMKNEYLTERYHSSHKLNLNLFERIVCKFYGGRYITSITYLLQQHPVPYVYYVLFQKVSEEILSLHFSIPRRLASYGTNFPTDFVFHESFPIFYNGLLRHSILINVCRISELVEEKGTLFPFFFPVSLYYPPVSFYCPPVSFLFSRCMRMLSSFSETADRKLRQLTGFLTNLTILRKGHCTIVSAKKCFPLRPS